MQRAPFSLLVLFPTTWISLGSGAVGLAHCDGSNTWAEVALLVRAVISLNGTKEGRSENVDVADVIKAHMPFLFA